MRQAIPLENVNVMERIRALLIRMAESETSDEAGGDCYYDIEASADSWIAEARQFLRSAGVAFDGSGPVRS
jgi:hypothetical protein